MRTNNAFKLRQDKPAWKSSSSACVVMLWLSCIYFLCPSYQCEASPHHQHLTKGQPAVQKKKAHRKATTALHSNKLSNNQVVQTYEQDTRLLAQAYQLEDLAANEYLLGDYGLAVKHLLEASKLTGAYFKSPSTAEVLLYLNLASAAESAGQGQIAQEAYLQCRERYCDLAYVHWKVATLLAHLGELDNAYMESRKAVEVDPTDPRAHWILSLLLAQKGQFQDSALEKQVASQLCKELYTTNQPGTKLKVLPR